MMDGTSPDKTIDGLVLVGDVIEKLRELPDACVQCCITSPPYLGLRDYQTDAWEGGDDETCDHMQITGKNKDFNARWYGTDDVSGLKKQEKHGERPFRDVCGRCGARRVSKWRGGDPDCKHQMSNARPDHSQGKMLGTRGEQSSNAASMKPQLRTCKKCGAERIDQQIGLENTPHEYVQKLVEVFREVRRVLKKDGTLWLNLGNSYAGGGSGARDPERWPKQSRNDHMPQHMKKRTGFKNKDLIGTAWMTALALQADGWWLRADIPWFKPNAMPSSVKDRPTTAHEYIFLLSKSARYYYDHEAIREPVSENWSPDNAPTVSPMGEHRLEEGTQGHQRRLEYDRPKGANARSVWTIPTEPSPLPHHAAFPRALPRRCLRAGSRGGDLVLDCFGGTGTTALEAQLWGRRWVTIDLNPEYAEIIRQRTRCQIGLPL